MRNKKFDFSSILVYTESDLKKKGRLMKINGREFKRISAKKHKELKKAAESTLKKLGRPPKPENEKYVPVYIKIDPIVLNLIKDKARKKGVPYQTLINELLKKAA